MTYLNKRGGRIALYDVKQPPRNDWGNAEEAFSAALQLEKDVNTVSIKKINTQFLTIRLFSSFISKLFENSFNFDVEACAKPWGSRFVS